MFKELVTTCPRCNEKLIIKQMSCGNCDLELSGKFSLSKFDYLSSEDLDFIELFLKSHGSFKTLQLELNMSYPAVKRKYNEILIKLGLQQLDIEEKVSVEMTTPKYVAIAETDSLVTRTIKEKLNINEGRALIPQFRGDLCEIRYDISGNGLTTPKIPIPDQLTWDVFDAAVEIVIKNGGKVVKGKAQTGARLGSDDLPIDSLEGYIAYKVRGKKIGETAYGPGFVVAAILDWADICNNERGYISIKSQFLKKRDTNNSI